MAFGGRGARIRVIFQFRRSPRSKASATFHCFLEIGECFVTHIICSICLDPTNFFAAFMAQRFLPNLLTQRCYDSLLCNLRLWLSELHEFLQRSHQFQDFEPGRTETLREFRFQDAPLRKAIMSWEYFVSTLPQPASRIECYL